MRHAEVHCVRPERRIGQGRGDRRIVQESLFFHHGELVVSANAQIRRPQTDHAVVGQIRVFLRDYAHAGHFFGPILHGGVAPELLVVVVPVYVEHAKRLRAKIDKTFTTRLLHDAHTKQRFEIIYCKRILKKNLSYYRTALIELFYRRKEKKSRLFYPTTV